MSDTPEAPQTAPEQPHEAVKDCYHDHEDPPPANAHGWTARDTLDRVPPKFSQEAAWYRCGDDSTIAKCGACIFFERDRMSGEGSGCEVVEGEFNEFAVCGLHINAQWQLDYEERCKAKGLPVLWAAPGGTSKFARKLARLFPEADKVVYAYPGNLGVALAATPATQEVYAFPEPQEDWSLALHALARASRQQLERLKEMPWPDGDDDQAKEMDLDRSTMLGRLHATLFQARAKAGKFGAPDLNPYRDRFHKRTECTTGDPLDALKEHNAPGALAVVVPPTAPKVDHHAMHRFLTQEWKGNAVVVWRGAAWFAEGWEHSAVWATPRPGGKPRKQFRVLANFPLKRSKQAQEADEGLHLSVSVESDGVALHGDSAPDAILAGVAKLGLAQGDYRFELAPIGDEAADLYMPAAPAIITPVQTIAALPGRHYDDPLALAKWARPFLREGIVLLNGSDQVECFTADELVKALQSWNHARLLAHPKGALLRDGRTASRLAELIPPQPQPFSTLGKFEKSRLAVYKDAQRVTKGPVYHANLNDAHGEHVLAEDLERVAWDFLERFRNLSVFHNGEIIGEATVVESYIEDVAKAYADRKGDEVVVRPGDWVGAGRWPVDVWKNLILPGKINAWSFEGRGRAQAPG